MNEKTLQISSNKVYFTKFTPHVVIDKRFKIVLYPRFSGSKHW